MNINSIRAAIDFKLCCEAKDSVLGCKEFAPIWENVNQAFEAFNSKDITLERLQEYVKGYLLFLASPSDI